jgi:hypothetical protein
MDKRMPQIDLDDYGFEGKKFVYEGNLTAKKQGDKLLFLVAETHKEPTSIGPNICNCIRLADDGVVGLVGLEYNPADENAPPKYERTDNLAADVQAIMQADVAKIGEPRFGTTVRRLSGVPVEVVENMGLYDVAEEIESEIKEGYISRRQGELLKKLKAESPGAKDIILDTKARKQAETDPEVIKHFRDEFGNHAINKERDAAMVANLMAGWEKVGVDKAAILNAGRKHIERIKSNLPADVRFICVVQPE